MNNAMYLAIPGLPLAGFLVLGLFGQRYLKRVAGLLATGLMLAATILACYAAYRYFAVDGLVNGTYKIQIAFRYQWLTFSESLQIDMGILADPISMMMIVIVCFVSLMVHVFSLGYMKTEPRFGTYYCFLSLFTFSMLGLVLSSNLFQTYIFWELVGVSSYLLIGFYYDRPSAVAAARKAFIVTRFADLGFLVGILVLGFGGDSLDFTTLIQRLTDVHSSQYVHVTSASFLGMSMLTWGLCLVFMGGAGKSAMFPLHIWLPDAMEGPTPVSALIHAATMVVAGVYLVARLFPLFYINHASQQLVTWVGLFSAAFAALIACTQTDIKRVLAYSTMSQIGYMMFALGVADPSQANGGGFTASMFHLFTHAFFKSLLFLCAGVIIHLVRSNDISDMGGLRKTMPLTNIAVLVACLAIAGIPPFAGFFSKEQILMAAWETNRAVYVAGVLIAGLTAFYMFRLYFSVFWNHSNPSLPASHDVHHAEGAWTMKVPLVILTLCSLLAGVVPFSKFITYNGVPVAPTHEVLFSIVPVAVALAGIMVAGVLYKRANDKPSLIASRLHLVYQTLYRKMYIDELYLFLTKKIAFNLVGRPAAWIDKNVVDGTMNGIAWTTGRIAVMIKGLQSGRVQSYALYFLGGTLALVILFVYLLK